MKSPTPPTLPTNWPLWLVTIFALAAAVFVVVTRPSIGYVESAIMMDRYEGAVQARAQLKKDLSEWEENIKKLAGDIQTLQQEFQEKNHSWNAVTRKEKQSQFMKKQDDLNRYRQAVSEKAVKREQELMEPVITELNQLLKSFGKEQGIDILFGTIAGGNILYGNPAVDYTEAFLEYANR